MLSNPLGLLKLAMGMQVNGLVNGYTATNLSIPLALKGAGLWQGTLGHRHPVPRLGLCYWRLASLLQCQQGQHPGLVLLQW